MKYAVLFVSIILGILWQGGFLFWFGPASASILLMITVLAIYQYDKALIWPSSLVHNIFLIFTAWCFLTVLWSPTPAITLVRAITICALPIGTYLYTFLKPSETEWRKIWFSLIAVGLVLFGYSILEILNGIQRPNSLFFNPNTHAAYLNLIIFPTVAYYLLSVNKKLDVYLGTCLVLLIFSQALASSRGASLGQYIGLVILLLVSRPLIKRQRLVQFIALYLSSLLLATLVSKNFLRVIGIGAEYTGNERFTIWQGSFHLLINTPWYGNGVGTYWFMYPPYQLPDDTAAGQNAHNDYLQFLIEGGIPAFVLVIAAMVSIFYYWIQYVKSNETKKEFNIELTAIVAALFAISFHSFLTFNLSIFSILFLCGLLLGRFYFIIGQTKMLCIARKVPVRRAVFKFSCISIYVLSLSYFLVISSFSIIHYKGAYAFETGKIAEADRYNALAMSIYPFDDRPYTLYVKMYRSILNNLAELNQDKRKVYFDKAIAKLAEAERINAYRPLTYYLRAKIIQENTFFYKGHWQSKVIEQFSKALTIAPKYIPASRDYATLLISLGDHKKASAIMFDTIKRSLPLNRLTHEFYLFAQNVFDLEKNIEYDRVLASKLKYLVENIKIRDEADFLEKRKNSWIN
jgi:O-antigen ligase